MRQNGPEYVLNRVFDTKKRGSAKLKSRNGPSKSEDDHAHKEGNKSTADLRGNQRKVWYVVTKKGNFRTQLFPLVLKTVP